MGTDWKHYRYLLLGTFKKDGSVVDTPVWFAIDGRWLYAFSNADAGKIKRLRNSDRVQVAPCTVRGKPLGDRGDARAQLLTTPAAVAVAHRALLIRYGWQMRLLDWGARLSGRAKRRAWIAIDTATSLPSGGERQQDNRE